MPFLVALSRELMSKLTAVAAIAFAPRVQTAMVAVPSASLPVRGDGLVARSTIDHGDPHAVRSGSA